MWASLATWPFSLQAVEAAGAILSQGGRALDAAEAGIRTVEADELVDSVGRGGFLNEKGELELDAAIMDGDKLATGAVAGVKHYLHPVSIARAVMEQTRHTVLIGQGAEDLAQSIGMKPSGDEELITEKARQSWEKSLSERRSEGHDTIGLIALDEAGSLCVGTSTSGASLKLPGRVGDSPLIGNGFYAESGIGAAAATGLGEDIMRTCLCIRCTEMMRAGMPPMQAAEEVIRTACERMKAHGREKISEMAIICMNAKGETGAAANHEGFVYAKMQEGSPAHREAVSPVKV